MTEQIKTPIASALLRYKQMRIVPFDVPGHKQGKGNPELKEFLGEKSLSIDVNSMKPLDNLSHPTSVIKEAEELAAEAFGCDNAFFMVNGTSSSVQAMIMSVLGSGDKIIMPRNVHKSAINALILSGAVPIYVSPGIHKQLGIPLGMSYNDVENAVKKNKDAKAIFVNNPTYYGVCSDLKRIIELAHKNDMLVLVDEAHGTHFYFGEGMPSAAMHIGADMSSVSVHKTGGSLTQSSLLLVNSERVNPDRVRTVINITQTTSASYLLLASIDIARKNLALNGKEIFREVVKLSEYARSEINSMGNSKFYAFSDELINGDTVYDFDKTKLSINTLSTGLAGIEVYDILRDDYDVQIEFGDLGNVLAIISVGDTTLAIERLVASLSEIERRFSKDKVGMLEHEYITPIVKISPRKAFYSNKINKPLKSCINQISGEFVMCYPPGIPIVAPGEILTKDIIEYIIYSKEKGCLVTGAEDILTENLMIIPNV